MGSTPNYSWQYPALTDPPNVPQHLQTLADATDATVKNIDVRLTAAEGAIGGMFSPPYAALAKVGPQPIDPNLSTTVYWDEEYADTANGHDEFTDNARYTAQRRGRYLFVATLSGTLAAPGYLQFTFRVTNNDGVFTGWGAALNANAGDFAVKAVEFSWLNVGDYVELIAYQTTNQTMFLKGNETAHGGSQWAISWMGDT
ncbi:hypothetical protein [Actinocorallia libanotica]|uniref:C1q domain-containing protein n=1 Tax=Actinocorallia libanotica TaxID=46162 RepID=A0ABN1Q645_9ACTN